MQQWVTWHNMNSYKPTFWCQLIREWALNWLIECIPGLEVLLLLLSTSCFLMLLISCSHQDKPIFVLVYSEAFIFMICFISCVCLFVKISSQTTCKLNTDSSRFNGKVRTTLAARLLHKSLIESLYVLWDVKISTTRIMMDPNHLVSHRHLEHKELHGFMGYFSRNRINQSCTC